MSVSNKRPPANSPLTKVSSLYITSLAGSPEALVKKSVNSDNLVTPYVSLPVGVTFSMPYLSLVL